jgi:hypothetical protein
MVSLSLITPIRLHLKALKLRPRVVALAEVHETTGQDWARSRLQAG